jgi:plasmid stabilization system protein ParE
MAYLVSITSRAERDLANLYGEINADQSDAALKWYRALKDSILTLEEQPNRCPLIRKRNKLRHLHGARRNPKTSDTDNAQR